MKSIRKFTLLKLGVTFTCLLLASCNDGYVYNDEEPDWLGDNVYDYLSIKGNYTTYLALVDALDQKEVLKRTGSKTGMGLNALSYPGPFSDLLYRSGHFPHPGVPYREKV